MKPNLKTTFDDYNAQNSFKKIFDFKGEIAPIAEKASRNLKLKMDNIVNRENQIHYFTVGHAFKNIDKENIFEMYLNEETRTKIPHVFTHIQKTENSLCENFKNAISDIRNINSHYIHDFQKLKTDTLSDSLVSFIKESFELAVLQIYLKENEISYIEFTDKGNTDKALVSFLYDKFYPLNNNKKELSEVEQKKLDEYNCVRKHFLSLSKDQAIENLLIITVANDFDWLLYGTHKAFTITAGKYLSYHACLFLLSMFLYKSEANQLISKIKGFKKNKEAYEKSKREIFTFFSKKLTSQDINSEENHLVKFRDIVQYLNHYPLPWKEDMELESKHPAMTNKLEEKIIEMEIDRVFPKYVGKERFHIYAKYQIWGKKYLGKSIETAYVNASFKPKEIEEFNYVVNVSDAHKGAKQKLADIEKRHKRMSFINKKEEDKIQDARNTVQKTLELPNEAVEKLQKQLQKNLFYTSYGRNNDRFMLFASRYLAEVKYFGENAKFKLYTYFGSEEQEDALLQLKANLPKKEYDKLKFHKGRLWHFITWKAHLKNYESWDTPFVVENNAIQLKISLDNGVEKIVSIQRSLMIYFLEDALFNRKKTECCGAGQNLLAKYFIKQQEDFKAYKAVLEKGKEISPTQKEQFKKLLPKRLLHQYSPALKNGQEDVNTLELILKKAKEAESRYKQLCENAQKDGTYDDFIKRNKGKHFKLQFVRKAWNHMYFKDSYKEQVKQSEHHKSFHITRDEFNDFCRYMFAFDQVPHYKLYLEEMLTKKEFFENTAFKTLFNASNSLEDMYNATKKTFATWLTTNSQKQKAADAFTLATYEKFFTDNMFYINLSHFIAYRTNEDILKPENRKLKYKALKNAQYLIEDFYYSNTLDKSEYKKHRKLFNKLRTVKLEDALLYEMAMQYLSLDTTVVNKARTDVSALLTQDVEFAIQDNNGNPLYNLFIPFKKIDAYTSLLKLKEEQETEHKSSYLSNIVEYWKKVEAENNNTNKEITSIYNNLIKKKKIDYDELQKIDAHLISNSIKFSRTAMKLEKYYLCKPNEFGVVDIISKGQFHSQTGCFHITWDKTGIPKIYFQLTKRENQRNKAFHFGVPALKTYIEQLKEIEKQFIGTEIKQENPKSYADLYIPAKSVCTILLDSIHDNFFNHKEKDFKKKRLVAEQKYFEQIIKK